MHLALSGPGADRAPAYDVRRELRRNRIEEFAAGWQSELRQIEQQPTREPEPAVDREAAVEVRIINEPLPTHRRARLLEVDAHDDAQIRSQLGAEHVKPSRVLHGGDRIMD